MYFNETHIKVSIGRHVLDNFSIQNGLKEEDLSPLLFNCALQYIIRKVQRNQVGLELSETPASGLC
jgi:hypothetical protein